MKLKTHSSSSAALASASASGHASRKMKTGDTSLNRKNENALKKSSRRGTSGHNKADQ